MKSFEDLKVMRKVKGGEHVTVCAFGASNTQRYQPGMHWFDCVELGFKSAYGGDCGAFLNAGVSGNTAQNLIDRFERDVARFRPDLTIVTIGGNDFVPETFRKNLLHLHDLLTGIGSEVLFQTYYACDLEKMNPPDRVPTMMRIVREVAAMTSSVLNDNDARWAPLRDSNLSLYRTLMRDPMHVNTDGNLLIGADLMRRFGFRVPVEDPAFRTAAAFQYILDLLER